MTTYCSGSYVKRRLYIADSDTTYHTQLTGSILEAEAYVDSVLRSYQTVPLTSVPLEIQYACADLAASIFSNDQKRKNTMQGSFNADIGLTYDSYWMAGVQKLKDYVEARYIISGSVTTHTSIDPVSVMQLYDKHLITFNDAKTLIGNMLSGSSETQARINLLKIQRDMITGSDAALIQAQISKLTGSDTDLQTAEKNKLVSETITITSGSTLGGFALSGTAFKTMSSDEIGSVYKNGLITLNEARGVLTSLSRSGSFLLVKTGSDL